MDRERVVHRLEPVCDAGCKVLVLGTMPSPRSRELGFYYGHPQNRFWRILGALFDEEVPQDAEGKRGFLLEHRIALWDVLASCSIEGASDASITDPVANDLRPLFERAPIESVFCTGAASYRYYARLCEPSVGIPAVKLPSPSAANAAWSLERLIEAYRCIPEALG